MTEKPVALLLTPVLPLPTGSGRALRAWDWLTTLARTHSVHVLAYGPAARGTVPPDYPAEAVWPLDRALAWPARFDRTLGLLLPILAPVSHRFVSDWPALRTPAVLDRLEAQIGNRPVERIVVYRLYLHAIARAVARRFPGARLDLDMDDRESRTRMSVAGALLRMGRYGQAASHLASAVQYALIERFVRGGYETVYLAAPEDCRLSTRLAGVAGHRPNRIGIPAVASPPPMAGDCRALFVGTLNYPPNEEAVRMLATQLAPLLEPPLRLCVVGRHAPPALAGLLHASPRIAFVPDVDELAPLYAAAHAVLVPLRAGGGTKFKTLEGFAHARPVISTRHGVRGLGAVAGEHYLAAETPSEFARAIALLARDRALAQRIAEAGHALCCERFGAA